MAEGEIEAVPSNVCDEHRRNNRGRDQWHGMSRTGRIACLYNHVEEPLLAMSAEDIRSALSRGSDFQSLQATLECRTECGSCIPEVKRLVESTARQAA